jgi:hypothetical protein
MKKFLIKTLISILPLLILATVLEFYYRTIPNDYAYKNKYLEQHSGEIETLIFGSSHSFYGINPEFMQQNTFNASHVSQPLYFDFEIFKKYENNFKNLKCIIIPISYFTLWSGQLKGGIEEWREKYYSIYYRLQNENMFWQNLELVDGKLIYNIIQIKKYLINNTSKMTSNELGWGTSNNSKNAKDLQETGETAAKRHTIDNIHSEKRKQNLTNNLKILHQFADFCKKNNVNLILITTPTYHTYRENLNKMQLGKMHETINIFSETHKNVVYLDYFECKIFLP